MTDRDAAFLWETEALRSATHRIVESELDDQTTHDDDGRWVTLREASRSTGIPVETLRKWARRATIPTYLVPTNRGTSIRMVDLDGVEQRAHDLGRSVASPPPAPGSPDTPASPPRHHAEPAPAPAGTMIVPIDAWNKMLNQLGNLHEAGQQLATAKERAAKAETEAKFLRERLAEIRQADADTEPDLITPAAEISDATDVAPTPPAAPEKVWRYLVRRVRDRSQG